MKKNRIKELMPNTEYTQEEFEAALAVLPDKFVGKSLKANINKYFKKDGTAKAKAQEGQEWHDTQGFIRRQVRTQIHVNRLKNHVNVHKQHVKDVKEKKTKRQKVARYGKLESLERYERKDSGENS